MSRQHYTLIEDIPLTDNRQLPELSDIEQHYGGGQGMGPMSAVSGGGMTEQVLKKFIRQTQPIHQDSGMKPYAEPSPTMLMMEEEISPQSPQPPQQPYNKDLHDISCISIANHIADCPICSKFYNNDKSIYIIFIVLLSIVCLLLLKRVLNV
jgi:hypothetical protein